MRLAIGSLVVRPVLLLALVVLAAPSQARGETADEVDPRYPISLELTGGGGLIAAFAGFGVSPAAFSGGIVVGIPVAEKRQLVIAALGGTGYSYRGSSLFAGAAVGYRIVTYADPWRFRFDLQGMADYSHTLVASRTSTTLLTFSGLGLGGRFALGGQYYFVPNFGAGIEVAAAVLGLTPHIVLDAAAVLTFNW